MLVLIVIAAIVVVAAVVFLAMGRGGEMSAERNDYFPIDLGPISATDVALLRPPTGLWGYNMQATDEAMELIAESIRERDVRIVALEQLVTDLSREHAPVPMLGSPYSGARHRRQPAPEAEAPAPEAEVPATAAPPDVSGTEAALNAEAPPQTEAAPHTEAAPQAEAAQRAAADEIPWPSPAMESAEVVRPAAGAPPAPPEESHD